MRKKNYYWAFPLTGMVLFGTAVSAEQDESTYLNSTNRLTLSLRFGLNIHSSFKSIGGSLLVPGSAAGSGQLTPNGDLYNYDDGYVLTDSTGNFLGLTTYWGYDNASQYNAGADTIAFHNNTAPGIQSDESKPYPGVELTYDRQFGGNENWHGIRYGLEGAINYLRISFQDNNAFGATVTTVTSVYQLPGTTPPAAPFQGTFDGSPGGYSLIGATPISTSTAVIPGATLLAQDKFDGNLWGLRLGPYVDFPVTDNLSLHLSAGLAVGLLYDQASWQESITVPGVGTTTGSGNGSDFDVLWGGYISLDASYQFDKHWGVEGGVQFEDLGKYKHNFSGREVDLNLSRSVFVQVGVSYSF
jgi:hypothetical protein